MPIEAYLTQPTPTPEPSAQLGFEPGADGLEDLLHQKSGILTKKLDILAAEMRWRLHTTARNLAGLEQDTTRLQDMLTSLDTATHYHLREHRDKAPVYQQLFEVENRKRAENVECWRDLVMVMRDFLAVWEAHEQSRSRAIFLNHVGTGT